MLLQLIFESDLTIRFAGMEVCLKQCSPPKKTEKNCSWKRDKKSFVTICCWLKTQFLSFTSSGNSCCRNLLVAKIRQTEELKYHFTKKFVLNFAKKCWGERKFTWLHNRISLAWTLIWIIIGFQEMIDASIASAGPFDWSMYVLLSSLVYFLGKILFFLHWTFF